MNHEEWLKRKHFVIDYIDANGNKNYREKRKFETEKEALKQARIRNLYSDTLHKYMAYKCPVCQKLHIGKGTKTKLTQEDRDKIRKKMAIEKFLN